MTMQEASKRYLIPIKILKEYESLGVVRRGKEGNGCVAV